MKVDTGSAAGAGIDAQTLQFHDTADRYTLNGASAIATLYSDVDHGDREPGRSACATSAPAAARPRRSPSTSRARSSTRARATRPGRATSATASRRSASARTTSSTAPRPATSQPDWVDPDRFDVPQADEQQRLLANLITQMNLDKAPLPRFWYLPRGEKAAVVLTGDDHGVGGTPAYFDRLKAASPAGCSVADWECVRATSYVYPRHGDDDGAGARLPGRRLRDRAAPQHGLRGLHAGLARGRLHEPARRLRRDVAGRRAAGLQPHALHRVERLGHAAQGGARARHPLRHELLLQGPAGLGARARPDDRLRLPAALRRPRRVDDRRLSVDDPGLRRDGHRAVRPRRRSTRCSTTRSARRTTGASSTSSCTPTSATTRA